MSREVILHPILLGIYTILFTYAHADIAPSGGAILTWLALSAGVAALLWGTLALVSGDARKAAIVVSVFIFMFFSYGHLKNLMTAPMFDALASVHIGPVKILACTWVAVWASLAVWLKKAPRSAAVIATAALNRAGTALVILSALDLVASAHASSHESRRPAFVAGAAAASSNQAVEPGQNPPDIYYIILDDYARSDVLKDVYHYDNTEFMEWLRTRGFYIADESHSNYSQTMLSLASSLNSQYLDPIELTSAMSTGSGSRWHLALNWASTNWTAQYARTRRPLAQMIQRSTVARALSQHGYRSVALTSDDDVQLPNADLLMQARVLDGFGESLIATTPVPEVLERVFDPLEPHRRRIEYVLDHLGDRFGSDRPLFVFAHILCPHPPLAFQADGTPLHPDTSMLRTLFASNRVGGTSGVNREAVANAYIGQVRFVNRRIESAIDKILAGARWRPIIILQSDHGSDMTLDYSNPSSAGVRERMSILNAYYAPQEIRTRLYPSVTPVNTFRILLGHYFSGTYGLLPDESYLSSYESPYEFVGVSEVIRNGDRAGTLVP
jgi:hypothetical protein